MDKKEKPRIGILTHYYKSKNLGGLLQSYALVTVLKKEGYQVEQISFNFCQYDSNFYRIYHKIYPRSITLRKIWEYGCKKISRLWEGITQYFIRPYLLQQSSVIACFEKVIPHSDTVYENHGVAKMNSHYDAFVIGSDQVFASYLLPFSAYYGEFAHPDKKVISYAASSDVKKFSPLAEKLFIKKLARLNAISVREKTLQKYIQSLTNREATVVLDPTFLLSAQDWLKIARPLNVKKPYIFCYFLGKESYWQRRIARAYADKYGYEIVHLPYIMEIIRPADWLLKGHGRYDVGPREFISLIHEAQCIFTDSFHGMALSINLGKNFYVFNRDDQAGERSMTARITDTLEMLSLQKRHVADRRANLDNISLDFTYSHAILSEEKQKSISWLLGAIEDSK